MMEIRRRDRGKNFTDLEKKLLQEITVKYKDIIDDKNTDKRTLLVKQKTWEQITGEYNKVQMTGIRNAKQLKALVEVTRYKERKEKNKNSVSGIVTNRENGQEEDSTAVPELLEMTLKQEDYMDTQQGVIIDECILVRSPANSAETQLVEPTADGEYPLSLSNLQNNINTTTHTATQRVLPITNHISLSSDLQPGSAISEPPNMNRRNCTTVQSAPYRIPIANNSNIRLSSPRGEFDEYDLFGQHVAAQLRAVPAKGFVILQEKIQSLITNERLRYM